MYVYNVTVNVDEDIHSDWLKWMKEIHIPEVMSTMCFTENRMFRVLETEEPGFTYSIQYDYKNAEDYHRYKTEFAPALQKKHTDRYRNKFVAFRTLLEKV
jgi:hypothetical protein